MWKLWPMIIGVALVSGCATTVGPSTPEVSGGYYYWLHPKLGHVKVDRATNAIVTRNATNAR